MLRARFRVSLARIDHLLPVPAASITDPAWLHTQLDATARRYRLDRPASVGVLWWYSVSSVLLGPPVESLARGGPVADPALAAVTLLLHPDGRVLDARSSGVVPAGQMGERLGAALSAAVDGVVAASGAPERALWAITTDSLANRALWAGASPRLAVEIAASLGRSLPAPRYVSVGGSRVVRRASCCLIFQARGESKCVSCPRQHPDERDRRLRTAFGYAGGTTR
ncbi:MAG TPA: (2Fe-2S)-binding protein [Actinophytocola sp.]|nr:(2Fe-2S)-binding protein [Actinophytocola sp.]